MKKKICDLTLKNIKNICCKHFPKCKKTKCPLYTEKIKECKHHSYKFWEDEIEIDD